MEQRRYLRVHVEYPASFSGASFRAQGIILDLSIAGCRVRSELSVKRDDLLGLLIDVPSYENPLYVPRAAVRWTNAPEFGMEFIEMELKDKQQLRELVMGRQSPEAT